MNLLLGIDLGGTNTKAGLVNPQGIISQASMPTRAAEGPEDWLKRLQELADGLLDEAVRDKGKLEGIGIDSPGTLDREAGKVVFAANLPAFNGYPLRDALAEALGVPAVLENDANTYAYGEYFFGAGEAERDLICFTLGTGVGGGIIMDGRLITGPLGVGGELGHITVEPNGRECTCGSVGCLECYASATGFKGMLSEALAEGRSTVLGAGTDVKDMARAASQGDGLALEMFRRAGTALGRAASILVVTTGIDLMVMGAGISEAFEPLMRDSFKKELQQRLHMADPKRLHVVTSSLGNKAAVMGAAAWAARCLNLDWKINLAGSN